MKAVIFAAGRGTRMLPLTKKVCKPMLRIHGRPILEYILNSLPKEVDEAIIVKGYFGKQIADYFGENYGKIKIKYVNQNTQRGTWDALAKAKKYLTKNQKFLVLNADDLHSKSAIKKMLKFENAILVSSHHEPEKFGVVEFDGENNLLNIQEKPSVPKSNFVSVGVYVLSSSIFKSAPPKEVNGELYLPVVIAEYLKRQNVKVVQSDFWVPIGNPVEYVNAHKMV